MTAQPNAGADVRFSVEGQVATIVLDRPAKLNAVTPAMADEIVAACRRCDADPEIRAVVLTGAGERAFCAGSDVAELDSYESAWAFRSRDDYCDAVRALRTPAVCAVNGLAYGGGLELALSCDVRLAASHATFAAPEIKLGWIGGGGMTYLLTHSIGASNAAQMVLTGDPVDAERALRMSLVSELAARRRAARPRAGARSDDREQARRSRPRRARRTCARPTRCRSRRPSATSATCRRSASRPRTRRGPGGVQGAPARRVPRRLTVSSRVEGAAGDRRQLLRELGYGPMPASIASTTARRFGLPRGRDAARDPQHVVAERRRLVEERARLGAPHDRVVRGQEQLRAERAQALDRAAVPGQVVDARRDQEAARRDRRRRGASTASMMIAVRSPACQRPMCPSVWPGSASTSQRWSRPRLIVSPPRSAEIDPGVAAELALDEARARRGRA